MNDPARHSTVGSKKILVMDDTPTVADLIREMLLSMGHQVELCLAVDEALGKFAPAKFDLVITDYMMPRMNGMEFAHVLRQRAPEQLILLITGSTFSMQDSLARELPVNRLLQKPFSVAEFQEIVAAMLMTAKPTTLAVPTVQDRSCNLGNQTARA
ncbi:MAG: DNA-binding response regulator [Pedosphaera sp.]|nr:DNA-binding response regulator [Pedosphaera sp.]